MKVGDLIGIGWDGIRKEPFVAVIKEVHRDSYSSDQISGYTIFIPATGKETWIIPEDVKEISHEGW